MPYIAHSGLGVSDLARSVRFYCEALGFERLRKLDMTSDQVSDFLMLDPPGDMNAVYLGMGDFQLELLKFTPGGANNVRARGMSDVGLTHISIGVENVAATLAKVTALGGEILTKLGEHGAMIRDPDGQFIELLDGAFWAEERKRRE
jgi:catechol 2,3-dioxygenase-like lactoylglutathione lyase family enzyme